MTRGTTPRAKVWRVAASLFALGCAAHIEARAGTVLRVAMTAGDIPDWTGQPDQGFEGIAQAGYAIYTPTSKLYGNPVKYDYDPAKATALLKEARCFPCAVTLAISTSGSGQMQPLPMNELVKAQLEAVGFKVKLEVMDWNALLDVAIKGREKFPQYNAINISRATQDPLNGLLRFITKQQWSPGGGNWGWYFNQEAEDLVAEAMRTFDEELRD